MKKTDVNYFPGFVRKAVCFSIDDGNLTWDKKFIDTVKPYGLKGTFNLCSDRIDPAKAQFYRDFYEGYEIANHVKYHPRAINPAEYKPFTGEKFPDNPDDRDPEKLYDYGTEEGMYWAYYPGVKGFRPGADEDSYIRFVKDCKKELEAVFGEGSVRGFVWPYAEQDSDKVKDYLFNHSGYDSVRIAGGGLGVCDFRMPDNRMKWDYHSIHNRLDTVGDAFEKLEPDYLAFFAIGVHSVDYENAGKWDSLAETAKRFSDRTKYYTAGVSDLFAYEDAVKGVVITETEISNPSAIDLYITVDGEKTVLPAGGKIAL